MLDSSGRVKTSGDELVRVMEVAWYAAFQLAWFS